MERRTTFRCVGRAPCCEDQSRCRRESKWTVSVSLPKRFSSAISQSPTCQDTVIKPTNAFPHIQILSPRRTIFAIAAELFHDHQTSTRQLGSPNHAPSPNSSIKGLSHISRLTFHFCTTSKEQAHRSRIERGHTSLLVLSLERPKSLRKRHSRQTSQFLAWELDHAVTL